MSILEQMFYTGVTPGMETGPCLSPPVSHELHGPAAQARTDF